MCIGAELPFFPPSFHFRKPCSQFLLLQPSLVSLYLTHSHKSLFLFLTQEDEEVAGMFYSQTFLARKGPLGTVWCAAHLQHKLRKTHYTSTDIPSTVDRIMFPEVPIALRMSSHLLLGVVRIYSKKVDYLYKDCNLVLVTLKKAFVHTDVDLPPNATQAQFNAVTLPETYQLDALDIDDILSSDPYQDSHVLTQDEITLTDETDNRSLMGYVAITFDDDIMQEESHPEPTNEGVAAMNEGIVIQPHDGEGNQEPTPSNTSPNRPVVDDDTAMPNIDNMNEPDNTSNVGIASHDNEEIEIMRDAVGDPNPVLVPELLDFQQTSVSSPVRHSEQIICDKETPTLSEENVGVQQQSPLFEPFSSGAMETPDPFQLNPSPVYNSPALELQPTPQPQPQPQAGRPRGRKRKQKQPFDKSTVLSNKVMNDRIADCSDIVKKRRKLPCSSSDTLRFNNRKMKEQVFLEPLISGLSSHIISMSEKDFFVSNPNLVLSEETDQVPLTTQVVSEEPHQDIRTEQPSNVAEDLQREGADEHTRSEQLNDPIEQLRDETRHHEPCIMADLVPSSPRIRSPLSHHNLNTPPLSPGTAFQSMQDLGTSSTPRSKQATPVRNIEADLYSGNGCPPHSPAFMASADDELAFLEMDSHSPADSQRTQGSGTLTARTRAVAQYLRGQSPLSSSPIDQHGDRQLSLKAILQGRSRKMCARMFFETLVLCNYGLINVEQEEPKEADEVYGDIKLRLTSQVSKGEIGLVQPRKEEDRPQLGQVSFSFKHSNDLTRFNKFPKIRIQIFWLDVSNLYFYCTAYLLG
ncbi:hypothetical protein V2J09_006140 [Rumex salicifolius]